LPDLPSTHRPTLFTLHFHLLVNSPATPHIHTLSLHDALPISNSRAVSETGAPFRCTSRRVISIDRFSNTSRATSICAPWRLRRRDRKSTRLNSSHVKISYAVFCLKKKKLTSLKRSKIDRYRYC